MNTLALILGWLVLVTLGLLALTGAWLLIIEASQAGIKRMLVPIRFWQAFRLWSSLQYCKRRGGEDIEGNFAHRIANEIEKIVDENPKFALLLTDVLNEHAATRPRTKGEGK